MAVYADSIQAKVNGTAQAVPLRDSDAQEKIGSLSEENAQIEKILEVTKNENFEEINQDEILQGYYFNSSYTENSGYRTKKYSNIVGGKTYYVSTKTQEESGTGLIHWFNSEGDHISYENKGIGVWEDVEVIAPMNAVSCAITGKATSDYDASRKISLKISITEFSDSNRLLKIEKMKSFKKLSINIDENKNLIIASKYDNDYDLWISITKNGASLLPQIGKIYKKENSNIDIGSDFTSVPIPFYAPSSDWVSPYGSLYAKENPDTDVADDFYWCGGWHGTDGGNGGYPTAKNIKFDVFVDRVKVSDEGTYYGDEIKVVVINGINAINTVKTDGTGRQVITETITYLFKPNCEINVDGKIEVNEKVSIDHYYGIQCEFLNVWNGGQLNVNDIVNKGWYENANSLVYGSTKSQSIINNFFVRSMNKKDYIECYIVPNYGLADRHYLSDEDATAYTAAYNKSYFILIKKQQLNTGDVLCWRGGYHFYSLDV